MRSSPKVIDAFSVLGLEESSSFDLVKTTYKQIALRIHPDKNPDDPTATAEFQRVSEAYHILVKHFDQASKPSSGPRGHNHPRPGHPFFGYGFQNRDDFSDEEDEDDYYEESESDDDIAFFMWFFSNLRASQNGFSRRAQRTQRQEENESPEAYQERLRRSREEQLTAQERRKKEAIARKERAAREREEERLQAEQRQKSKIEAKKAKAEAARKSSENRAKELQRKAQVTRSSVFAAARSDLGDKVKKGIWEDSVDAAGGEVKGGCSNFVTTQPQNPQETLLHIAAQKGDLDLVKWLDAHGAELEEKDSQGLTAFHVALKTGQIAIVNHFLETYPPNDSDFQAIYECADPHSLLSLAVDSREPQLVFMILEKKLATPEEIKNTWASVASSEGLQALKGAHATLHSIEKADDIIKLLMRYGDFSPPSTLKETSKSQQPIVHQERHSETPGTAVPAHAKQTNYRGRGRGKYRGRGRGRGA